MSWDFPWFLALGNRPPRRGKISVTPSKVLLKFLYFLDSFCTAARGIDVRNRCISVTDLLRRRIFITEMAGEFYCFPYFDHLTKWFTFLSLSLFVLKQKVTKKFKHNNPIHTQGHRRPGIVLPPRLCSIVSFFKRRRFPTCNQSWFSSSESYWGISPPRRSKISVAPIKVLLKFLYFLDSFCTAARGIDVRNRCISVTDILRRRIFTTEIGWDFLWFLALGNHPPRRGEISVAPSKVLLKFLYFLNSFCTAARGIDVCDREHFGYGSPKKENLHYRNGRGILLFSLFRSFDQMVHVSFSVTFCLEIKSNQKVQAQ